ncbi:hypothetical protein ACFO1V_07970 [Daeguia caeni]|uniref:Ycf15 n=1 Tax=Daeguia caeni TaxID=439612 RepID=A0ABV9H6M6_9HYPH
MNKQIPSELSNGRLDTSYSDTIRSSDLPLFISPEIKTIRSSQKFGWKSLFAVHTVETPHKGYPNTTRFYVLRARLKIPFLRYASSFA